MYLSLAAASPPLRRLAALLLLAALVSATCGVILPVGSWYSENQERISDILAALPRLRAVAEYEGAPDVVSDKAAITTYRADFLPGSEDALIMADLQTRLRGLVIARNSELSSAQVLPPRTIDGLTYLGVRIQLRGQLRDVHAIVHSIETATSFLFIERTQLRLEDLRIAPAGASQTAAPRLLADIDVFGAKWPLPEQGLAR
jgi:hypothetical protein